MTKFTIDYCKTKPIELKHLEILFLPNSEEKDYQYNPFLIQGLQKYQPIYSLFFEMTENNYSTINLKHRFHMINMNTVFDISNNQSIQKPVFIKYSPLYDPIKYMIGKYNNNNYEPFFYNLPTINSNETNCNKKIYSVNNAAYTDGFFSYLSSHLLNHHGFDNGIDFYGSYLGIQDKFKMNISDDYEYLNNSTFFNDNIKKMFDITQNESAQFLNYNSRGNKHKLNISCSVLDIDDGIIDIETIPLESNNSFDEVIIDVDVVYQKEIDDSGDNKSDSSDSEANYTTESNDEDKDSENSNEAHSIEEDDIDNDEDDEDENDSSTTSSSSVNMFAYIHKFPIHMICLEKCDGTFDELFENEEIQEPEAISALFQVIMTLITYQKAFHFTHNDLHTNNIMYKKTNKKFIYYKYNKVMYRVPTFGRIFKLIDFGRSIYKCNGQLFCSDSFAPGGDAATQYNFEPFHDENKPLIIPNYSFDLCRLGTSIFDFTLDIDNMVKECDMTPLQKIISRWCTDDSGKNILYKKNGEERYPNFKLYKMIARTVHEHLPEKQLKMSPFKEYEFISKKKYMFETVINIDKIPCYA